jgi:hypothetical protein
MTIPPLSQHDLERLSSFLDGQFTVDEGIALQRDLAQRADLREGLEALRQTRAMLQHAPRRKVPRNFMLKPEMAPAHRRRPVTRPVLSLGLASVLATVFLLLSIVLEFVPLPSFGASAPMAPVMPLVQDAGSGRNQAPQPTRSAEMSQPAATAAPTAAPEALPTGVQKAIEPTKPAATPTAPQQMRTTGDIPPQATPAAPLPTKPPAPTLLPTQAPSRPPAATQPAPTEPEYKLMAQPTLESALPGGTDTTSAPQQARKTLTWLQTLLVVLAASTALAALYLRRKH